jgi:SAM-dependent methyltransferase
MPYYKPVISPIVRFIRRLWYPWAYRGTGVFCPLCRREFRSFVNKACPGCGCGPGGRLMWLYLQDEWPGLFRDEMALIQFAPIPALDRRLREHANIRYLSADLYEPEAMVRLDLTHLDLPDECFDIVICMHVLAHISNDRQAMREIFRILRPGGFALITTPLNDELPVTYEDPCIIDPEARDEAYGEWDFVRMYGRDFVDRLQEAGFDVEIVRPCEKLDKPTIQKHGLFPDERVYICRRLERSDSKPSTTQSAIADYGGASKVLTNV